MYCTRWSILIIRLSTELPTIHYIDRRVFIRIVITRTGPATTVQRRDRELWPPLILPLRCSANAERERYRSYISSFPCTRERFSLRLWIPANIDGSPISCNNFQVFSDRIFFEISGFLGNYLFDFFNDKWNIVIISRLMAASIHPCIIIIFYAFNLLSKLHQIWEKKRNILITLFYLLFFYIYIYFIFILSICYFLFFIFV